jgi:hypothetical protein
MVTELSSDTKTLRLGKGATPETIVSLVFGPDFLQELAGLEKSKQTFDIVVVNTTRCGFLFPAESLIDAAQIAKNLLNVQGALVFAKSDKALAIVRESIMGLLSFHTFDTLSELYDYSPSLASEIQVCLGKDASGNVENTDLAEQVLMSTTPVLTDFGVKLKVAMESPKRRNILLCSIDNYTPLSNVLARLTQTGQMSAKEALEEIESLEQIRAIYPIFPKIPFLVHCFRNHIPFKLGEYLIAAKLITQDQLDEITFEQQNTKGKARLNLGTLAVSKGYIDSRQLELALQDQAFYGQGGATEEIKVVTATEGKNQVQSLVGHLGTTDPAGLLQSLSTNRETGVLSVEHAGLQFRALYDQGRITHCKLGKIRANNALIEFVSGWHEGIFVFIQRQPPPDLADESCKLTKPLDKLLLDSALASDNIETLWKKLPKGSATQLEKCPDAKGILGKKDLICPLSKEPLNAEQIDIMQRLWKLFDGLTSVKKVIQGLQDVTTSMAAEAIDRLLAFQLVTVPAIEVTGPMEKFQQIIIDAQTFLGQERNQALLRLALHATLGYSVKARMFNIGSGSEIAMDLAAARAGNISLSAIVKGLEDWQVKYIEYLSQEIDRASLREIVCKVHSKS